MRHTIVTLFVLLCSLLTVAQAPTKLRESQIGLVSAPLIGNDTTATKADARAMASAAAANAVSGLSATYAPLASPTFSGVLKVGSDTLATNAAARAMVSALLGGYVPTSTLSNYATTAALTNYVLVCT